MGCNECDSRRTCRENSNVPAGLSEIGQALHLPSTMMNTKHKQQEKNTCTQETGVCGKGEMTNLSSLLLLHDDS